MDELGIYTIGDLVRDHDAARRPVKASERRPGSTPYYGASGVVDWVEGFTHDGEFLLVSEDGENLRARSAPIAFLAKGKIWVNNHAHVLTGKESHDTRFLAYALAHADVSGYLTGSAQPKLSQAALKSIKLRLPSSRQRRAIAEVLGGLDDKIAANDKVASLSLSLARLKYESCVRGRLTTPMTSVLEPLLGGTPSRSDVRLWDGAVPWTSAKDVANAPHGVVIDTSEGISTDAALVKRLTPLPRGSVILTARGTVGKVARLGISAAINQSCYGFAPGVVPAGCLTFMIENVAAQARGMTHGSIFDTITMRTFNQVWVPELSPSEWESIESRIHPLLAISTYAVVECRQLRATRDELLPLLMSGKLRVRDAERVVSDAV